VPVLAHSCFESVLIVLDQFCIASNFMLLLVFTLTEAEEPLTPAGSLESADFDAWSLANKPPRDA
jgi:hypothetical protein